MSAVIAVVLVLTLAVLALRFHKLMRDQTRREQARYRALAKVHPAPVDPIDWDAVARRYTQPMRRIEVAS